MRSQIEQEEEGLTGFLNACAYQNVHYWVYAAKLTVLHARNRTVFRSCRLWASDQCFLITMSHLLKVCGESDWLLNCWVFPTCSILLVVTERVLGIHRLLRGANSFPPNLWYFTTMHDPNIKHKPSSRLCLGSLLHCIIFGWQGENFRKKISLPSRLDSVESKHEMLDVNENC